ncbi:MAG: hypothetical protein ACD_37C00137G0001, partial [uncultured bacterium]
MYDTWLSLSRRNYLLLIVLLLSALYKIFFLKFPIFGLEYEDAFVYADVARQLQYSYLWQVDSFQTKTCMDGSLVNCLEYGTFNGHFMVLPLIISVINGILGYSTYNIFIFNFFISLVVLVFFFKILSLLKVDNLSIFFSAILYVTTPFINIQHTSGFSETLSSLFVIITLYYFLKSLEDGFDIHKRSYWIAISMIIVSFAIKRENLILISLPVIYLFIAAFSKNVSRKQFLGISLSFFIPLFVGMVFNYVAQVSDLEKVEGQVVGGATFTLTNFSINFPNFLSSLQNFKLFGMTGGLVFLSLIIVFLPRFRMQFKLIGILVISYSVLYSLHYRSYYQVHYNMVNNFETLRYTTNFFPILCLLFGAVFAELTSYSRQTKKIVSLALMIYLPFITLGNFRLRYDIYDKELVNRIDPVRKTLDIVRPDDWVISDISSVFHLYANENLNVEPVEKGKK